MAALILLHGARQPADLLYVSEYPEWERLGIELMITVDRADPTWRGHVGVVPLLFNRLQIDPERTVVLTCGPEILMRFAVTEALNRRVNDCGYLLFDGTEHAMRGRPVRPLPARAGVPLQGRPRLRASRARAVLPPGLVLTLPVGPLRHPQRSHEYHARPRLGVFKFASCDGCQLSLLDCEDQLLAVADRVEIAYFLEATRRPLEGEFDIALVEGSVSTPEQENEIRDIRGAAGS